MSPEQALGREDIDDRSDLYSIGVVLHEMLYGAVPAERPVGELDSLATPTSHPDHEVPRDVWEVVRKAIALQRESRYQSAEEFIEAIDALPEYASTYVDMSRPRRRGVRRWKLGLAAALVPGAFLAGIAWNGGLELPWATRPAEPGRPVAFPPSTFPLGGTRGEGTAPSTSGSGAQASPLAATLGGLGAPRRVSHPRPAIRDFFPYRVGDVLRYQSYRNGIPDRELTYTIRGESERGVFAVNVSPGERSFTWVVDEENDAFFQEFQLPDPRTGELSHAVRRKHLRLPPPEAVVDRSFNDGEVRVQLEPVDLDLPADPKLRFGRFASCLRAESREEGRVHYHYFQAGTGLVGIEVHAEGQVRGASTGAREPPIYARYLIEYLPAGSGRE